MNPPEREGACHCPVPFGVSSGPRTTPGMLGMDLAVQAALMSTPSREEEPEAPGEPSSLGWGPFPRTPCAAGAGPSPRAHGVSDARCYILDFAFQNLQQLLED